MTGKRLKITKYRLCERVNYLPMGHDSFYSSISYLSTKILYKQDGEIIKISLKILLNINTLSRKIF